MNYSIKELISSNLPGRWTVEVTYRDGSSPTTFTIEELGEIDERIELSRDWIAISLNRYAPEPAPERLCQPGA
jgi:hypothetical protein